MRLPLPHPILLFLFAACADPEAQAKAEHSDVHQICLAMASVIGTPSTQLTAHPFTGDPLLAIRPESAWGRGMITELTLEDPIPPAAIAHLTAKIASSDDQDRWQSCGLVIEAAASAGDMQAIAMRDGPRNTDVHPSTEGLKGIQTGFSDR